MIDLAIDWGALISQVLQSVLMIGVTLIVPAVIKWAYAYAALKWNEFKAMKPNIAGFLEKAAEFAVQAAEQAGAAEIIADKKEYACMVAEKWLAEYDIVVDLDVIAAAIEKAVAEQFPKEVSA